MPFARSARSARAAQGAIAQIQALQAREPELLQALVEAWRRRTRNDRRWTPRDVRHAGLRSPSCLSNQGRFQALPGVRKVLLLGVEAVAEGGSKVPRSSS